MQQPARALVDERVRGHLKREEDFGFESTYSGTSRPRMVWTAAQRGYTIRAVFVGTGDPGINIVRIAARVRARTGHHVADAEVERRCRTAPDKPRAHGLGDRNGGDHRQRRDRSGSRRPHPGGKMTHLSSAAPRWAKAPCARVAATQGTGERTES